MRQHARIFNRPQIPMRTPEDLGGWACTQRQDNFPYRSQYWRTLFYQAGIPTQVIKPGLRNKPWRLRVPCVILDLHGLFGNDDKSLLLFEDACFKSADEIPALVVSRRLLEVA